MMDTNFSLSFYGKNKNARYRILGFLNYQALNECKMCARKPKSASLGVKGGGSVPLILPAPASPSVRFPSGTGTGGGAA